MIFVIEKMFSDHQARIEAWERARDKHKESYDYYSDRDYINSHPRPGHSLAVVGKTILIGLAIAAFCGILALIILSGDGNSNKHQGQAATVQKKETKQAEFKLGDKVQVVKGDYEDSVGVIVKLTDNDAIIKLTNSTLTHEMCKADSSCSEGGGHDNGELLAVNSLDNLVPYKEVK